MKSLNIRYRLFGVALVVLGSVTPLIASTHLIVHDRSGATHYTVVSDDLPVKFTDTHLIVGNSESGVRYEIGDVAKLTYDIVTSVPGIILRDGYRLSTEEIQLTFPGRNRVCVCSLEGMWIRDMEFTDECRISLSELPKGAVLLNVNEKEHIKIWVK